MYLQPYNNPRVQLLTAQKEMRSSTLNLAQLQQRPGSPGGASVASGFLLAPSSQQQLSRSQGNLLKLPGSASSSRSPSPTLTPRLNLKDRYKSRSMNTLESEDSPDAIYQNPRSLGVPSLRVDPGSSPNLAAGDSMGREESVDRGSEEGSEEGDDSEFSFSDDGSTFSGTSSLNVSRSDLREELQRSRTPDPPTRAGLSPDSGLGVPGGRLMPSRSQPNLANLASTPKVPPRPRAKELSRCTTVTRKNAMAIQNQLVPQIGTITSY